jgi:hypothetical protein
MAQQYPKAEVIEVDLPEVVVEKQRRLEKGKIANLIVVDPVVLPTVETRQQDG